MTNSIKINAFTGMNNVRTASDNLKTPSLILNADTTAEGRLTRRGGHTKVIDLAGAYSLWACKFAMLVAAGGSLYRISQGVASSLGSLSGPEAPLSYSEANGKAYISNQHWNGVFNPGTLLLEPWGIPLPEAPRLSAVAGNLPGGIYHVCFTVSNGDEISGNGPISRIVLEDNEGIGISNLPENGLVWVTDPDGEKFFYAGNASSIVSLISVEPLPTFLCYPPEPMGNICFAFGRMWGSRDNVLIYTEPYQLGLTQNTNRFELDQKITMIARVTTGLFVGLENRTVFFAGTEPTKMIQMDAGSGAVKGTLCYCNNLGELGDVLGTSEKVYVDVPVWLSQEGIVAGNPSGRLFNLTNNKVKFSPPESGAALYRDVNGVFQFLTSFPSGQTGSGVRANDPKVLEAFKNGHLRGTQTGGDVDIAAFSDNAVCEVYRAGQLI
ncbi:MAG: hypothetical protein FP816_19705 [Desulfobacteraceae bacterium]|nr:hypothetical protein [Desulfobacteraceae bacterium]MBU4055975.1 hypothetical protein [Pseudomonadota bacterium]